MSWISAHDHREAERTRIADADVHTYIQGRDKAEGVGGVITDSGGLSLMSWRMSDLWESHSPELEFALITTHAFAKEDADAVVAAFDPRSPLPRGVIAVYKSIEPIRG
jgi:hypothetical protein